MGTSRLQNLKILSASHVLSEPCPSVQSSQQLDADKLLHDFYVQFSKSLDEAVVQATEVWHETVVAFRASGIGVQELRVQ